VGSDREKPLRGLAELEETLELYRSLVRASPDAVTATDLAGRITAVSRRTVEIHGGVTDQDLLGRAALDLIAPEERERATENTALALERNVIGPVEYSMLRLDGSRFAGELYAATVRDARGNLTGFVATVRDITEKKRSQAALEESEARYRTLVELSPDAVVILRGAGYAFVNDAFTRLFDYTQADVEAGLRFLDLVPAHERAAVEARYQARLEGGRLMTTYQLELLTKGGRLVPCETSARLIQFEGAQADLVIIRDLTERVRAAEQQSHLDARLKLNEKLESLGMLAGGVAHDFNNILMGIQGTVDTLRLESPETVRERALLSDIETAVNRASELCEQLLAYAGRRQAKVGLLDLNSLVAETAKLLEPALPRHVRLARQLADELPPTMVNATQVRQAIMNLITNAADAVVAAGGTVTLRSGVGEFDADYLLDNAAGSVARPGTYAYVEVADTGVGMPSETLERAFEPFYTTKSSGRGMGLVSVRGCVRAHHGALRVHTAPGAGSTFRLLFPVIREDVQPRPTGAATRTRARRGVILVVDDESLVRNVIATMVASEGYEVLMAERGEDALELFGEHQSKIAGMVVDLRMPSMSGRELLRAVRETSPDLPILIVSGHHDEDLDGLLGDHPPTQFLQKPFSAELLSSRLRSILPPVPIATSATDDVHA
jgi:two-component system cell cycle sensor histidine kinase/response regulator CckA